MSAKEVIEQIAPTPWHYFSDGKVYGNDGDAIADCYGNAAHLVDPAHRAEAIVYAVNRLPDYEAAVEVLRWIDDNYASVLNAETLWDEAAAMARAALARLRGTP